MSWNDTLTFDEGLKRLRGEASATAARTDRPTTIRRGEIKMAHSVFQPRCFDEDLHKDEAHIGELVRALRAKPEDRRVLDPVLVMAIGSNFYVIDGHHRLLAYARAGVDGAVPVEHFSGALEDAIKEAVRRNAKDTLAMTHSDKMEAAWKLVVLNVHSKREIAEATGTAASSIGIMRATRIQLEGRHQRTVGLTWTAAKKALKGEERQDFSDEMREAQVREWAKRFAKTFGGKALKQSGIFADALGLYSDKLPRELVEYWADLAVEVVEELRESGDLARMVTEREAEANGTDEPPDF